MHIYDNNNYNFMHRHFVIIDGGEKERRCHAKLTDGLSTDILCIHIYIVMYTIIDILHIISYVHSIQKVSNTTNIDK